MRFLFLVGILVFLNVFCLASVEGANIRTKDVVTDDDKCEAEVNPIQSSEVSSPRQKRFFGKLFNIAVHYGTDLAKGGKDTKETIKTVKTVVKTTVRFVKKVSHKIGEFTEDLVKGVYKFAKKQIAKIKNGVIGVYKFAKEGFKKAYDTAKKAVQAIKGAISKIPFKKILDVLLNLLVDAVTIIAQEACEAFCETCIIAALTAMFPAVGLAGKIITFFLCPPLCEAAIATIKDYLGIDEDLGYIS